MERASTSSLLSSGTAVNAPAGVDVSALKDMPASALALLQDAWAKLQEAEQTIEQQERQIRDLRDLASTDELTRLMNRRGFEDFFEQELSRLQRSQSQGAILLLLDLDNFKMLNDTHGHLGGDACLKALADTLLSLIRFTDGAGRLGGDEFAVLLTQTDAQKVTDRIDVIRESLNGINVDFNGVSIRCSGSVGVTRVQTTDDYAECYRRADESLYKNKEARKAAGLRK